jgi:hypothetical protein
MARLSLAIRGARVVPLWRDPDSKPGQAQLVSLLRRTADVLEQSAALADAHAERHEQAGRSDDAAAERRVAGGLVRLRGGLVRMPRNGQNSRAGGSRRPLAPGPWSRARHSFVLGDGISVAAAAGG